MLEYLDSVISDKLILNMLYVFIASIITIGSIEFIAKGVNETSFIKDISNDVALSTGRAMYTIGSTLSGSCLAASVFSFFHSKSQSAIDFGWLGLGLGILMFLYGFFITFWCNKLAFKKS